MQNSAKMSYTNFWATSVLKKTLHYYYSAHSPLGLFSDRLHQVLRLLMICYLLSLDYLSFITIVITFLDVFILTHPVNFPYGRKPERPEKTHDFRQSVGRLFPLGSVASIEPTISEVKGACSDDCATEAQKTSLMNRWEICLSMREQNEPRNYVEYTQRVFTKRHNCVNIAKCLYL
jgi:hypothetical protein